MCEREIERQHKKEQSNIQDSFDVQITVPSLDIQIDIHAQHPCDCIELAGRVITALRQKNLEPQIEVMP